ncbi:DUF3302 domain-containing protein [Agaribacterium haliotis]|uniref:DUF3302 domain-containing protein n=1 Tax=Agaribacterium haliotis TaxID=2013869 RepID=UPI0032E4CAF0
MLDYFALGLLIFVFVTLFYGVIVIHDIPYDIAKKRNHPQQDAIHVAGWVSLFTLHVLWPFLWIWATLYRDDRGWGFIKEDEAKLAELEKNEKKREQQLSLLQQNLAQATAELNTVKTRLSELEQSSQVEAD